MSHPSPFTHRTRRGGFTLVELLIVVIILAILAAIVIPQFTASTSDARDAAIDSTLANMRTAIELYAQQHDGAFPAASSDQAGALTMFWDQLTKYTKNDGTVSATKDPANFPYGPYLRKNTLPKVNDDNTLVITDDATLPLAATGTGGWIYSKTTGQFRVNDPAYDGR